MNRPLPCRLHARRAVASGLPPLLAVLMLTTLSACGSAAASDPEPSPTPDTVKTIAARYGRVKPTLRISGVIAPHRQTGIAAVINEPIAEIRVHEGEHVRAGEILAVLETDALQAQLASAQQTADEGAARAAQQAEQAQVNGVGYAGQLAGARASLAQARAALAGALTDRARYERLYAAGFLAQQVLAQQNVTVAQDREAVSAAQSLVRQAALTQRVGTRDGGLEARQIQAARSAAAAATAAVQALRSEIAKATIKAPEDGTVEAVNAAIGEYPAGRQLFTLHDDGAPYAMLAAATSEAIRIRGGEDVTLLVDRGALRAHGTVEALLDQLAPGSTNYTIKVRVTDHTFPALSGMPVAGIVHLRPVTGVVVPTSAFTDEMRTAVYVVNDGKAKQHTVNDLAEDGTDAVVRDLPEGSRVVVDGQGGVADGDAVKTR